MPKQILLLIILTAGLVVAQPTAGDRPQAEEQDKLTTERLRRDGDFKAALAGYENAHQLDPSDPRPLFHAALICSKLANWAGAIKYYEAFIALDSTSEDYVQAQRKLDDARKYLKMDSTPEGRKERQQITAKAEAEAVQSRERQEVEDVEKQLADYNRRISESLTEYLPTSQHVTELRNAREQYYKQVEPKLQKALLDRETEVVALSKEMTGTAAPLVAKRAEVEQLKLAMGIGGAYQGLGLEVQRIDRLSDYTSSVDKIADVGANTVLFAINLSQENGSSNRLRLDVGEQPSADKLAALIQYAHSKRLRVVLMPRVMLEAPVGNQFRGNIHPTSWKDWWVSYREMFHYYDRIAEETHVDLLVIGSELITAENQIDEWTETIRQVRGEYHGQISYSANWDHYAAVPFWNQLDLIGMNGYYDLGTDIAGNHVQKNQATISEMARRWLKIQSDILAVGRKFNKPVVMLEVGWCSVGNAVTEPWDYTQSNEPLDLDIQKRLYEAYFQSWYGRLGFGGYLIWAWTPTASGLQDRGYTPEGKPAEIVLRTWFAKGPWLLQLRDMP